MKLEIFDIFLTAILVIAIISITIGGVVAIVDITHDERESSMMVMEVQKKEHHTVEVLQSVKPIITYRTEHTYYLIDNDIKVEVSSTVYKNTKEGDKVCIIKTTHKDDRTGEITKITYRYGD